ncbi:MAG: glycosyltransferase family 39 protein [Phormidesmis sp.]
MTRVDRANRALEIFLLLCIAVGIGLRSLWIGKRELWYDEVLSVLLSSGQKNAYDLPNDIPFAVKDFSPLLDFPANAGGLGSLKEVVKGTLGDPHPPLFYAIEHIWMGLFGNSEVALRSVGMVVSWVTLLVAYALGKRVLGRRGGLIFTALMALNPFFLVHSLNLRMYALMVFWVVVSGWCWLALNDGQRRPLPPWLLRIAVAIALLAGLMSQYLFAYWFFALAALALYLNPRRWLANGLTLLAGIVLFVPWALWGVRQQANNRGDVLSQISSVDGPLRSALEHGRGLAQTLANHLLLGHLTTGMAPISEPIKPTAVAVGCGVIGLLAACVIELYRRKQYKVLIIASLMGLLPLAVALAIDVAANTYTLGFGWGRSAIVALPGCLLLVAAWLELATGRGRTALIAGLLAVYLAVNVADFEGRDRQMFHAVNDALLKTDESTLVVINSRAWGHVLRLAYYLSDNPDTEVLAANPDDVTNALKAALAAKDYRQVLWLKAEKPLWGEPETAAEADALSANTEAFLRQQRPFVGGQTLQGTMDLDQFELQIYGQG